MLQGIDECFQSQVIASLKWLAFSVSPLQVDQLAEIFRLPSTSDNELNMVSLFSPIDVLKYFPGLLVTQEEDHGWGRKALHVRLAHFSIKEYLTSDRILQGHASTFAFTEEEAHLQIGSSCLAYHLRRSDLDEYGKEYEYKLLKYASRHWAEHLEMIPYAYWPSKVSRQAILAFSIRSQSLFIMVEGTDTKDAEIFIQRPYCYTALRGFLQLTEKLISRTVDVNRYLTQLDLDEGLRYASENRRKDIVKLFLDKGAQIRNFLEEAAAQGDAAIVGLLLDHGAKTHTLAGKLDSALRAALWNGHLDVLKLLLTRGANINSPFGKAKYIPNFVPVPHRESNSVSNSVVDCLNFLLNNGAGVNMNSSCSLAAALYVATDLGYEAASRLLLERGASLNELAGPNGYPLQASIRHGNVDFVKFLLDCGADPNTQGGECSTALQMVCFRPMYSSGTRTEIIKLLIHRGADVCIQGGEYGTALQAACRNGDVLIEDINFLIHEGAAVNAQGGYYCNALQAACHRNLWGGNELWERVLEIVQLLLSRGADVNAKGGYYGTALQAACDEGHKDLVLLLINNGADVNAQEGRYGTALQAACENGKLDLVRLLLKEGAHVDTESGYHGTALQAACANGHLQVAQELIKHGANVHMRNNGAWHAASQSRNDDLVRLLLDHGVDVNDPHGPHGSALHATLLCGLTLGEYYYFDWNNRIRFLLDHGADPNLVAGEYGTILQAGCTVKCQLRRYRNMFYGAAIPKFLLEAFPNINVNAKGGLFGSALQAAAYSGQTPTISLLLNRGAHVNVRGGKYGSALNAAVIGGNWDIVQVLMDAGAIPDCHILLEPDEEWLQRVLEDDGQGGVERYRKFWEVEMADEAAREDSRY